MERRNFIKGATAACGLLIVKPQTAFSYAANSAVRLGLLGCGRRGTSVATSFARNAGAHIVALADIFPDQLAAGKEHFDALNASLGLPPIDPTRTFRGHDAYKAMAACADVDAVQISTPPFFHVEHLDAITSAGKHAYCEKPMGVDVPQTRRALEIGRRVDGKVSVDVGFQIRSAPPFVEIVRRIHEGGIGKIACISAHYNAPAAVYPDRGSMPREERRLRNWLWDRTLSGDILLEQNIHVIDVCNWIVGANPISALAHSSRKVVQNFGDTSDNYQVIFTYPGDVELTFSSTQFGTNGFFDVAESVFGSEGIAEAPYSGPLRILGAQPWTWAASQAPATGKFAADGAFNDNLAQADAMKDRSFIESITSGRFHNQIAAGVDSALSCMMARKSAAAGRKTAWQEMEKDRESYAVHINLAQFT